MEGRWQVKGQNKESGGYFEKKVKKEGKSKGAELKVRELQSLSFFQTESLSNFLYRNHSSKYIFQYDSMHTQARGHTHAHNHICICK